MICNVGHHKNQLVSVHTSNTSPRRYPDWHVQSISVRKGCVVVELNMVELIGQKSSKIFSEPSPQELIAIMQSQSMFDLDDEKGSLLCINVSLSRLCHVEIMYRRLIINHLLNQCCAAVIMAYDK